jgi:hypothetical protein
MAVALPFGGTVALTIMYTVFNNTAGIASSFTDVDIDNLTKLPADELEQIAAGASVCYMTGLIPLGIIN